MNLSPDPVRRTLLAGMALGTWRPANAQLPASVPASPVTTSLNVNGRIRQERVWTVQSLGESPAAADLPDTPIIAMNGEVRRTLRGYRGVRLSELVPAGDIIAADHSTLKRSYLVARASDGYAALFPGASYTTRTWVLACGCFFPGPETHWVTRKADSP